MQTVISKENGGTETADFQVPILGHCLMTCPGCSFMSYMIIHFHKDVRRQMSFLGHVLRKEEMEHLVVTGFVDGKHACGRQRETFLTYLGKFMNKPPMEL